MKKRNSNIKLYKAGINYVDMPDMKTEEEFNLMRDSQIELYKQKQRDKGERIGTLVGAGLGLAASIATGVGTAGALGTAGGTSSALSGVAGASKLSGALNLLGGSGGGKGGFSLSSLNPISTLASVGGLVGGLIGQNIGLKKEKQRIEKEIQEEKKIQSIRAKNAIESNKVVTDYLTKYTGTENRMLMSGLTGSMYPILASKGLLSNGEVAELEKGEMVFRNIGNKYQLIKDYKNAPVHNKGGVITILEKGDIVIPNNKREEVERMMNNNGTILDRLGFTSLLSKLPSTSNKMRDLDTGNIIEMKEGGKGYRIYEDGRKGKRANREYRQEDLVLLDTLINEYEDYIKKNPNANDDDVFNYFKSKGYPIYATKKLLDSGKHGNRFDTEYDIRTTQMKGQTNFNLDTSFKGRNAKQFVEWYYGKQNNNQNNITPTSTNIATNDNTQSNITNNTTNQTVDKTIPMNIESIPTRKLITSDNISTTPELGINQNIVKEGDNAFSYLKGYLSGLGSPTENNSSNSNINSNSLYPLLGILSNTLLGFDNKSFKIGEGYAKMLMAERPELRDATYVKFDELKYNDRSQPLRNQLTSQSNQLNSLAQNISGGSAQNLMNIYQNTLSNRINQLQQIDNQEAGRLDQINAQNVGIRNQQEQINKQYYDMNVTANEQNRARARDLNRLGYSTLFQLAQMREQNRRQMTKDNLAWLSDIQFNNKTMEGENLIKSLFYQSLLKKK